MALNRRHNPFRLLNSVPFGISLMVLIALYLASGSVRPWLRELGIDEWPVLRDWFDKTDLQFFNAWPLKVLMGLLIANLVVVTWRKIPLTPPRYGVWCVHAGLITLVLGTSFYYGNKLEGRVRIYTDPAAGPNSVDHYYDKDERSLYVRTGRDTPAEFPLPGLPRFKQYDAALGNADALRRRGDWDLQPTLTAADQNGNRVTESLADLVGSKGDVRMDVVGFYPYATVSTDFVQDAASATSGAELSMGDPADPQTMADWWVVGSDPRFKSDVDHMMDVQHVDVDAATAAKLAEAAEHLFRVDVTADGRPGGERPTTIYVKPGGTYPVGRTGYTLAVENYNPSWSMFGTGEPAHMLQLMVTTPSQQYRRMVLDGKPTQTDFKLNMAGAGPMGKRQKAPLDDALKIAFHVEDPFNLMPQENSVKHTLVTPTGSTELVDIAAGFSTPAEVHRFATGTGDIAIAAPAGEMGPAAAAAPADHPAMHVRVERHDHLRAVDTISPVPASKRDQNADDEGQFQALKVKVRLGDWSQEVVVPYTPDAADRLRQDPWRGGFVTLPGAVAPLQLQLGNTRRELPVRLTLDQFQLVPYPGASAEASDAMMRDFRSTVTLSGSDDAETSTEVASMNHPIYFDNGRWLFFQAAYDPNKPHQWTQLGVGNRPAVRVMIAGCVLIFVGLAYAFYVKPVIIRRMKLRAIAAATAAGRVPKPRAAREELVAT